MCFSSASAKFRCPVQVFCPSTEAIQVSHGFLLDQYPEMSRKRLHVGADFPPVNAAQFSSLVHLGRFPEDSCIDYVCRHIPFWSALPKLSATASHVIVLHAIAACEHGDSSDQQHKDTEMPIEDTHTAM